MLGPEAESTHALLAMMSAQNAEALPARSLLGVLRSRSESSQTLAETRLPPHKTFDCRRKGGGWCMQTAEGGKSPVDQVRLKGSFEVIGNFLTNTQFEINY